MIVKDRLEDVYSYQIFDSPHEKELDELTELASIICNTPISLITILDNKRQWFKSNKGLPVNETKIEHSFCQHTLHQPNEVLVVNDALKDHRFKHNKFVLNDPKIRFYAGAPLITKGNNVLGTLCVIDRKPRKFNKTQEKALLILAKKAMDRIETKKIFNSLNSSIKLNSERLTKITENVPLGIFELLITNQGKMKFSFLSSGMKKIHPGIKISEWLNDAKIGFSVMHPEDVPKLQEAIEASVVNGESLYLEYRVKINSGYDWHAISGHPQKIENGDTIIYGSFSDVTHHYEYQAALEQIAFDISHVLRRPVASILSVTNLIELEEELTPELLKEYSGLIKTVAKEIEQFTRTLNNIYSEKKNKLNGYKKSHIH